MAWLGAPALVAAQAPAAASAAAPEDAPVVTLRLSDGSIVVGRIVEESDTRLRVATEYLGEISIDPALVVERGSSAQQAVPAVQSVQAPPASPTQTVSRVAWQRTFSVGGSYISAPFMQEVIDPAIPTLTGALLGLPGRQLTLQSNVVVRRVSPVDAFQVTGGMSYMNAQPIGTLTRSFAVDAEYRRSVSPKMYWLTRTTERQDEVRNVDNAFLETLALGFVIRQTPRFRLDLLPGIVVHREVKQTQYDDDWLFSGGAMAALVAQLSPTASLEARVIGRRSVQHGEIYSFESYTGVAGAITPRVGMTIGLTYNFDNLLGQAVTEIPGGQFFPGSPAVRLFPTNKRQVQLTSGLQVSF